MENLQKIYVFIMNVIEELKLVGNICYLNGLCLREECFLHFFFIIKL